MSLNNTINIKLKDFILHGELDYIKIGQTKEWIQNNFIPYDSYFDSNEMSIWEYGGLEFHFDHNILFLIWCDNLEALNNYPLLQFELWFLEHKEDWNLLEVLEILNEENSDYTVKHNKDYNNVRVKILKSNVILHFESDSDSDSLLIAFGLSDSQYENFDNNKTE